MNVLTISFYKGVALFFLHLQVSYWTNEKQRKLWYCKSILSLSKWVRGELMLWLLFVLSSKWSCFLNNVSNYLHVLGITVLLQYFLEIVIGRKKYLACACLPTCKFIKREHPRWRGWAIKKVMMMSPIMILKPFLLNVLCGDRAFILWWWSPSLLFWSPVVIPINKIYW